MANIRQIDTPAQTGEGIPDEALGPGEEDAFEAGLERVEGELRQDRERRFLRDNPEGVGPTLGQDLDRPNPGQDVDWEDEDYDPPT